MEEIHPRYVSYLELKIKRIHRLVVCKQKTDTKKIDEIKKICEEK